jgi:hypothetical protein
MPSTRALGNVACNARVLAAEVTGVQRYLKEVLAHADCELPCFRPSGQWSRGMLGHAWEQIYLPRLIGRRLLWSPGNTGPMFLRRQVVTVHDMMQFDYPQYYSRAFAQWYRFLVPRLIRISRKVLTMSEYVKSRILHYVPQAAGKTEVIALGASKNIPTI